SNSSGSSVRILDVATGTEIGTITGSNNGVAIDPATGNVYVVSWSRDRVSVYSPSNLTSPTTFGSSGTGNGQFTNPWDIDIVNGPVYVTDSALNRVQAFTTGGSYLGQWGTRAPDP